MPWEDKLAYAVICGALAAMATVEYGTAGLIAMCAIMLATLGIYRAVNAINELRDIMRADKEKEL